MGTIGSLIVTVDANTEKFTKGLKKARDDAGVFGSSINKLTRIMTGLATTFAAGFTVRNLAAVSQEMDRIGKTASRLGVATEAMSGLAYAAEISDGSLEGLVKGLTLLEKGIGNGSAADPLKHIGLSIEQLKSLGADQALYKVADAINKLKTPAEKTAAAMELFGKNGAEMLPFIAEGSRGIKELAKEAGELGVVFDDKVAASVDKLNDSITRLKTATKGLSEEAVKELGPVAALHADVATQVLVANRRFLFGTEKGPRQEAARAHIASMNDSQFMDFTRANPLGQMDEFLSKAARERIDKMAEAAAPQGGVGIGTAFSTFTIPLMMKMAAEANRDAQFNADWRDMGGAEAQRISNAIAEMDVGKQMDVAKTFRSAGVRSNAALQEGTAAAFSQERRSQQAASLLDVNKKQLQQQQQQTKSLQNIDKNIAKTQQLEIVNIA